MLNIRYTSLLTFFLAFIVTTMSHADGNHDDEHPTKISTIKLTPSVYMLVGKGGNLGVFIGADGTFLIDDQFPDMTKGILKAIKKIGGNTPKFIFNTHWHDDHTSGNVNLGKAGSIIIAHDNTRKRLIEDQYFEIFDATVPALSKEGWPVITFDKEMTFHFNNDTLEVTFGGSGHTDADSIVFFKNNNVLHAGDLFFNGFYPFIDHEHGGSLKEMAVAADKLVLMVNDDTKIIPGHGPLGTKQDLMDYRDMIKLVYKRLSKLKNAGKNVEEAIAAKPLADLDEEWGDGIFKTDQWIKITYDGLD